MPQLNVATVFAGWRTRRKTLRAARRVPPADVLVGYSKPRFAQRNRKKLLALFAFTLLIYSMLFTLIGRFLLLQFLIPLILLLLVVVMLLPNLRRPPTRMVERFGIAFLFGLLIWPDYLALALPGLPWLTALRLFSAPLFVFTMICVSGSPQFRRELAETLNAIPLVWKGIVAFTLIAFLSIFLSRDVGLSINKFVIAQLYWTLIFFVAVYIFRTPGRAQQFGYALWAIAILLCLVGVQEWRHSVVPWAGSIPSFLAVEDENVARILSGSARAASGLYRVQAKYATPLGFAEYLAFTTPFIIHFMMRTKNVLIAGAAALSLPFIFWTIINTDSRLGVVGFFMSLLLYMFAWGALRWYRDRDSLFGPAVVLAYPAVLAAFIAATFYVGRLRAMVWGSGAQQFSTQARQVQYETGIPKVLAAPWGYGIGLGADTLGFTNQAGRLTIDTYYLVVALEYGIIGFFVYYGMFIAGLANGARILPKARSTDTAMLAPICIALTIFIVVKSIFSQQENHPLVFAMLGAVVALVWRAKLEAKTAVPVPGVRPLAGEVLDGAALGIRLLPGAR